MAKRKIISIIVAIAAIGAAAVTSALISVSCGTEEKEAEMVFAETDFGKTVELKAERCFPDIELGMPGALNVHPAGFLMISDRSKPKMLQVIDLEDGSLCQSLVSKGRASQELYGITDISFDGEDVILSSTMDSKVMRLNYADGFEISSSCTLKNQFLRAVSYKQGYLTLASAYSGNRMEVFNTDGAIVDTLGSFPDLSFEKEAYTNALFQAKIAVSPDNSHIIVESLPIDYLDIYDKNGELVSRLHGPDTAAPEYKKRDLGMGVMYSFEPRKMAYMSVVASEKSFYAGHIGVDLKTKNDLDRGISSIYEFSYSGKARTNYKLDVELENFTVDTRNGVIYGITNAYGYPELVRFKM